VVTLRLFRQRASGEWDDVVASVATALSELIKRNQRPKPHGMGDR
jgi:hypothetical protein